MKIILGILMVFLLWNCKQNTSKIETDESILSIDTMFVNPELPTSPPYFGFNYESDYVITKNNVIIDSSYIITDTSIYRYDNGNSRIRYYQGFNIFYEIDVNKKEGVKTDSIKWFTFKISKKELENAKNVLGGYSFLSSANRLKLEHFNKKFNRFVFTLKFKTGTDSRYYMISDTLGKLIHVGCINNELEGGDLESYFALSSDSIYLITPTEIYNFDKEHCEKISYYNGILNLDEINQSDKSNYFSESLHALGTRKLDGNAILIYYFPNVKSGENNVRIMDVTTNTINEFHNSGLSTDSNSEIKFNLYNVIDFDRNNQYFALFDRKNNIFQLVRNKYPFDIIQIPLDNFEAFNDFDNIEEENLFFRFQDSFYMNYMKIDINNKKYYYGKKELEND